MSRQCISSKALISNIEIIGNAMPFQKNGKETFKQNVWTLHCIADSKPNLGELIKCCWTNTLILWLSMNQYYCFPEVTNNQTKTVCLQNMSKHVCNMSKSKYQINFKVKILLKLNLNTKHGRYKIRDYIMAIFTYNQRYNEGGSSIQNGLPF